MRLTHLGVGVAVAALAGVAASAPNQPVSGPVATYWMSAGTDSGMGAGAAQQPQHRMNYGDMARMEMTGQNPYANAGNQVGHVLILQLGSSRAPTGGGPQAEHDPPQGLDVGPSLPLVTPSAPPQTNGMPPGFKPQGRMLVYWGCGDHVGPNQPYVIDMSALSTAAPGKNPFGAISAGVSFAGGPMGAATYGMWPNEQSAKQVPGDGSLQGAHTIHGNYTPDINFTLSADQDFLPPVQMVTNQKDPSGSVSLGWRPVDGAAAYLVTAFGAAGGGDIVAWSSSATQVMGSTIPEYLGDGDIGRLLANHMLLPTSVTSCQVPAEVVQKMGMGSYRMIAYANETSLSSPARPPSPQPWRIAWQVKVRYRSANTGLLGMDMAQMMGQGAQGHGPPQQQQQQQQHPHFGPFGLPIP